MGSTWPTRDHAAQATAAAALVMTATQAAPHTGLIEDAPDQAVTASARALTAAWRRASDGGRRDALTACAEVAARAGADPDVVASNLGPSTGDHVGAATDMALMLLHSAAQELADGADRLLPDAPWLMPVSATGRLASNYVCDSTIRDTLKVTALALLAALIPPEQRPQHL